jgi:trehalose/maltose transport system substrate-binding protein
MSKKTLSLFLVLSLMVGVFGIGSVAAQDAEIVCPEGEAQLSVGAGSVGAEREFVASLASQFSEACPNITIDILDMPDGSGERLALYLQFFEAQSSDIDLMQVDVIWPAIIAPHVVDLNDYLSDDEKAMYFPDMLAGQTVDGKLVALPWFVDAAGLYYRTDLLEQYGVEVPETWADVAAAAQAVQDGVRADTGNNDFWGFVWQGNDYEGLTCDAHEWLVAETGETFISAEGEINVLDENWLATLETAAEWVGTISPQGVTTYQEDDARNVFQAGNAAFMRNWPYAWNLGNADDSPVAGMIEYVPLPAGATRVGACMGGWQMAVSRYSDNVDAAAAFAKYVTGFEGQVQHALTIGNAPTIPAVYEVDEVAANPLFSRLGAIVPTAYARPSVATGARYNEASALFSGAIHDVLTGELDALTAMENLEMDLEDLVADIQGN